MDFDMVMAGKKSGQIPAFGNWDDATDLPITQYFETARDAGLLRFPANNAAAAHRHNHRYYSGGGVNGYSYNDLYADDFQKPPIRVLHVAPPRCRQGVHGDEEYPRRRRQQRSNVVVVEHPRRTRRSSQQQPFHTAKKPHHSAMADVRKPPPPTITVKPVDEDLYKIPPELLLRNSRRKKMMGFFSRCLVPHCA